MDFSEVTKPENWYIILLITNEVALILKTPCLQFKTLEGFGLKNSETAELFYWNVWEMVEITGLCSPSQTVLKLFACFSVTAINSRITAQQCVRRLFCWHHHPDEGHQLTGAHLGETSELTTTVVKLFRQKMATKCNESKGTRGQRSETSAWLYSNDTNTWGKCENSQLSSFSFWS